MISAIRNKFGSRLLDVFIWASIAIFVLLMVPIGRNRKGRGEQQWAVEVNGEVALYSEYQEILETLRQRQRMLFPGHKTQDESNRQLAVDFLKDALLFQSQDKAAGIVLNLEQLRICALKISPDLNVNSDGTLDFKALYEKLQGNPEQLEIIKERIQADFEKMVREQKNSILDRLVQGGAYFPKFLINNAYEHEYALKKFSMLTIPYQKCADLVNKQKINDEQLKEFFRQENQDSKRYWSSELRSGEVWRFKPENFGIKVSDKQVKSYYYQHRESKFVKNPAQVQVRRILFAVNKKQDQDGQKMAAAREKAGKVRADLANEQGKFAELAKLYSDDSSSASNGGLLDFFGAGERDPELTRIAFSLSPNDISEIIETNDGLEIIQSVAQKPIEFKSLELVNDEIKQAVLMQQFNKLFMLSAKRAIQNPDLLKTLVESKKAERVILNLAALPDRPSDETRKLFEIKKEGSSVILSKPDLGEIITLKEIVPAKAKEFEQVRNTVLSDYKKKQVVLELEKSIKSIMDDLRSGKKLADVAKQNGLQITNTPFINRSMEELKGTGFPLDLLWSIQTVGSHKSEIASEMEQPNGYLAVLTEVQSPKAEDFESKKPNVLQKLFEQNNSALAGSFIASLRKDAKIKVNTTLINV